MATIDLLAKGGDSGVIYQIIFLVVLLVLSGLGSLIQKAKKKYEQQGREDREGGGQQPPVRQAGPPRRPPTSAPAVRDGSVGQIVQVIREAARQQRVPVARQKPIQLMPEEPRQHQLTERHVIPPARGQEVDEETARLRKHLEEEQAMRARRVTAGPKGELATKPFESIEEVGAIPPIKVHLDVAEARRAIIYSEILGPPLSIRRHAAMWEV